MIEIYDNRGALLHTMQYDTKNSNVADVDLSGFNNGMFAIRITTADDHRVTKFIVKTE
jgi:hypothetical protein